MDLNDFNQFASAVVAHLELDVCTPITPQSGLFDDLALDSVQAFELLGFLEERAGIDPVLTDGDRSQPWMMPDIVTMEDAHAYFRDACALAKAAPLSAALRPA